MENGKPPKPTDLKVDPAEMTLSFPFAGTKRFCLCLLQENEDVVAPRQIMDRCPIGGLLTIDLLRLRHKIGYAPGTYVVHIMAVSKGEGREESEAAEERFTLTENQAHSANVRLVTARTSRLEEQFEGVMRELGSLPEAQTSLKALETAKTEFERLVKRVAESDGTNRQKNDECLEMMHRIVKDSHALVSLMQSSNEEMRNLKSKGADELERMLRASRAETEAKSRELGRIIASLEIEKQNTFAAINAETQKIVDELKSRVALNDHDATAAVRAFETYGHQKLDELMQKLTLRFAACVYEAESDIGGIMSQAILAEVEWRRLLEKARDAGTEKPAVAAVQMPAPTLPVEPITELVPLGVMPKILEIKEQPKPERWKRIKSAWTWLWISLQWQSLKKPSLRLANIMLVVGITYWTVAEGLIPLLRHVN